MAKVSKSGKSKRRLTSENIRQEIEVYLQDLSTLRLPVLPTKSIALFVELKRGKVEGGRYPGRALFEVANRVMSDLVVLASAEHLLSTPLPKLPAERLSWLNVCLGTENGWDLEGALSNDQRVIGECFNVAPTFFKTKYSKSVEAMNKEAWVGHRIVAFNQEAVDDAVSYRGKCSKGWTYLPIDVPAFLDRWKHGHLFAP